jgi:hypothetical protein
VTGDAYARHALAPMRRRYPRKQFADAEGFGEIVIRAGVERPDLCPSRRRGRTGR